MASFFQEMREAARRGASVHDAICDAMGKGVLRCATCGAVHELSRADVREFVANGWPACCGDQMGYYTGEEAKYFSAEKVS